MRTEFEFIRNIKTKYELRRVGDDCAVLPNNAKTDLVITADMLVEDVDFRLEWTTPSMLGAKALAVSLSDIAAMGGSPKWALVTVGSPERLWSSKFIDRLYEGWFEVARMHGVELIGGDVSRTPDKLVLDSIVGGYVPKGKAIYRSGAKPGDSIFVTGELGGAAAGLMLLESGVRHARVTGKRKALIARQLCPTARVEVGKRLSRGGIATAMIDISDGLVADLYHVCDASGVGARIELNAIPFDKNLGSPAPPDVFSGGEDFELLFTSKKKRVSEIAEISVTRIGEITRTPGVVELIDGNAMSVLARTGFEHF